MVRDFRNRWSLPHLVGMDRAQEIPLQARFARHVICALCFVTAGLLVLVLPTEAHAQWRGQYRNSVGIESSTSPALSLSTLGPFGAGVTFDDTETSMITIYQFIRPQDSRLTSFDDVMSYEQGWFLSMISGSAGTTTVRASMLGLRGKMINPMYFASRRYVEFFLEGGLGYVLDYAVTQGADEGIHILPGDGLFLVSGGGGLTLHAGESWDLTLTGRMIQYVGGDANAAALGTLYTGLGLAYRPGGTGAGLGSF